MTDIKAAVRLFHETEFIEHFETFDLRLSLDMHWQINALHDGAHITLYKPSDEGLQSIIDAAQAELARRKAAVPA